MKQEEVFKKIGGIIREINEQYEYLETTGGVYNDLELELMVANSHFLSDHIEILRKLNVHAVQTPAPIPQPLPVAVEESPQPIAPKTETAPEPLPEPRYFEPVVSQAPGVEVEQEPATNADTPHNNHIVEFDIARPGEDHIDHLSEAEEADAIVRETEPEPELKPEVEKEPETIRHELTLEDIGEDWEEDEAYEVALKEPGPVKQETVPQTDPVVEEPEAQPEPIAETPEPPVAEKPMFKPEPQPVTIAHTQIMVEEEQVLTLNERMSAQLSASRMSEQLGAQPIADLKSAISLNDKLLYVKDLFNGYGLAYNEAIDRLNSFNTFAEAESFLKSSYTVKNHWDEKVSTADKFYALLQRRYLS